MRSRHSCAPFRRIARWQGLALRALIG